MRVLIVEDEIFSANYLKDMLEKLGHTVIAITDNAEEAYQLCKTKNPQIVLMDIMLKGAVSGAEVALKISDDFPHIVIIFLTAYSDKEMIEYAVESKAFAYLLKPYRIKEIDATMQLAKTHLFPTPPPSKKIRLENGYLYDLEKKKLYLHDHEIWLSPNMRKLLDILCEHKGDFVPSQRLVQYIWGETRSSDALRALIYRLKKMTTPNLIQSSIKKGYKISTSDE